MIERLLAAGFNFKLAMRRCVLGKDALRLFPNRAKLSTSCGNLACRKTYKQNKKGLCDETIYFFLIIKLRIRAGTFSIYAQRKPVHNFVMTFYLLAKRKQRKQNPHLNLTEKGA